MGNGRETKARVAGVMELSYFVGARRGAESNRSHPDLLLEKGASNCRSSHVLDLVTCDKLSFMRDTMNVIR